jgi:serine protease Do
MNEFPPNPESGEDRSEDAPTAGGPTTPGEQPSAASEPVDEPLPPVWPGVPAEPAAGAGTGATPGDPGDQPGWAAWQSESSWGTPGAGAGAPASWGTAEDGAQPSWGTGATAGGGAPGSEPSGAAAVGAFGATEPTVPSAAWQPAGAAPGAAREPNGNHRSSGMRSALIGGLVGALVGALAAGGIVAASHHNTTRTVIEAPAGSDSQSRTASVIQKPGDIASILAKVRPSVVRIDVTINSGSDNSNPLGLGGGSGGPVQGVGTGFIISPDGYIATNAHVVANATSVQVKLDGGQEVAGHVVGASTQSDLAVVKINGKNLPVAELGDSDALVVGDQVVAIGNALGLEGEPTVTSGIVSGLDRVLQEPNGTNIPNCLQTDASINPGNSGGPLVNAAGQVVGINTAIADPSQSNNIGFAISINQAKTVITALQAGRQPQLAFLGISTETVGPGAQDVPSNLSVTQGAYVTSVASGSAAASAGLHQGDVVVRIDNQAVTSSDDVINIVRRHAPGEKITVVVNRNGTEKTYTVTLQTRSSSS